MQKIHSVLVADTETTGLMPYGISPDTGLPSQDPDGPDRICSLGLVRMELSVSGDWVVRDRELFLFNPGRPAPEAAARVNGFCWQAPGAAEEPQKGRLDLSRSPAFSDHAELLHKRLQAFPLVFHNAPFDMAVLDAEFERAGLAALDVTVGCTKAAFSDMQGLGRPKHYVPGTNLNALCDHLGVNRRSRVAEDGSELHGALLDAGLAAECFAKLEPEGWLLWEASEEMPHRLKGWGRISTPAFPNM